MWNNYLTKLFSNLSPVLLTPVINIINYEYLTANFCKKILKWFQWDYAGAWGKLIREKNLKLKISWQTSLKPYIPQVPYLHAFSVMKMPVQDSRTPTFFPLSSLTKNLFCVRFYCLYLYLLEVSTSVTWGINNSVRHLKVTSNISPECLPSWKEEDTKT